MKHTFFVFMHTIMVLWCFFPCLVFEQNRQVEPLSTSEDTICALMTQLLQARLYVVMRTGAEMREGREGERAKAE